MTIQITTKEPASQVTDIIGLKDDIAYVLEQYDFTVEMIDVQEVER